MFNNEQRKQIESMLNQVIPAIKNDLELRIINEHSNDKDEILIIDKMLTFVNETVPQFNSFFKKEF